MHTKKSIIMKRKLLLGLGLLLSIGGVKAQFSPYNYTVNANLNRGIGNDSIAIGVNGKFYESPRVLTIADAIGRFFPNVTDGAYKLRALSYSPEAQFTLADNSLTIKNALTVNTIAKTVLCNINNASAVVKFSFTLDLLTDFATTNGSAAFIIAFGNSNITGTSTLTSSSNPFTTATKDIFGSFRVIRSGSLVTQFKPASGTSQTNTTKYLIKPSTSQKVDIFVNSSANTIKYKYKISDIDSVSLSANTYHVYVDGEKHVEDFPKVGGIYEGTSINTLSLVLSGAAKTSDGLQDMVKLSNLSATYQSATDPTLPVSLTSFNAAKTQKGVQLNWQTASEQNNQYFDILRSTDEKDFISIGTVKGSGTVSELKNYVFADNSPVNGYNYYKLKQVDGDGKATVYDDRVQAVNFSLTNNDFNAYFSGDNLFVKFNADKAGDADITITSIVGQQLLAKKVNVTKGSNEFVFDLRGKAKGIYVTKVNTGSTSGVIKIVK